MSGSVKDVLTLLRPKQWVKSAFVLAPLFFSLSFASADAWKLSLLAVAAFILASSSVYVFNDLCDVAYDRNHPVKKNRPIASGRISRISAVILIIILASAAFALTVFTLPESCWWVLFIYAAMNIAYSRGLKKVAILDVLIIATGFVLRVVMGGYAINVAISPWIVMATFTLALFLCFCKRHHEVRLLSDGVESRKNLDQYSLPLLDKLINVSCATSLMTYSLYAVDMANRTGKMALVYTVVFVAFGLFRYLQFVYVNKEGGAPEQILFSDLLFLANIGAWLSVTLWILLA